MQYPASLSWYDQWNIADIFKKNKLKLFHNIFASGIAEERLYKSTNNASIHWIPDGQQFAEFSYNLKWFVMVR